MHNITNKLFTALLIMGLALQISYSYAAEQLPYGCFLENYQFAHNDLVLNTNEAKQQLFFVKNRVSEPIQLSHHDEKSFFNTNWTTDIGAKLWSAFAVDQKDYTIRCSILRDGKQHIIPCQQVLGLCHYARARFELSNEGSYWVTQNQTTANRVIHEIRRKGVRFRRLKRQN